VSLSDIEIAQKVEGLPIAEVAGKLGIPLDAIEPYGRDKAKLSLDYLRAIAKRPAGKLILVTAISPTPAGEGKTTTTIGLGDALNHLGKRAVICIREPSMGPVFGQKGGATGGGYAQVIPMEDINLHFTGDFAAIAQAHNLLAAMLDNHLQQGNALGVDPRRVTWRRVVDTNDRALRDIVVGLGGPAHGVPRQDGFDIVVASEVMAILCLADGLADLKTRLGRIVVGATYADEPVTAADLKAHGAMAALLKHAIKPNLVQTLEGNPALLHGGPFANIAHGCNSLLATRAGLSLGDYVVTEAGFGADLGAEKFLDIKCRKGGLSPAAAVVVATLRALKFHGGAQLSDVGREDLAALEAGLPNLERHVANITTHFGLPCVVAINQFTHDTPAEMGLVRRHLDAMGVNVVVARHWAEGGKGAVDLAREVVRLAEANTTPHRFLYDDDMRLFDKMRAIAGKIYGANEVTADPRILARLAKWEEMGYRRLPVCMAKTQMSFSTDPQRKGAPNGHAVNVREVRLAAGAEFIVAICGDILTMPGLPKKPAAENIDITAEGRITGLF
jgi:formate--tetrahydrofolate ligase